MRNCKTPVCLLPNTSPGPRSFKSCSAMTNPSSVSRMVGRGYDDIDFAALLIETAKDAGLELTPDNVKMSDGLES